MLYPIGNVENLKNLDELASLQNQVKPFRLQDKLGKQNFHEDMNKVFEPVTKSLEILLKISQKLLRKLLLKTTKQ